MDAVSVKIKILRRTSAEAYEIAGQGDYVRAYAVLQDKVLELLALWDKREQS